MKGTLHALLFSAYDCWKSKALWQSLIFSSIFMSRRTATNEPAAPRRGAKRGRAVAVQILRGARGHAQSLRRTGEALKLGDSGEQAKGVDPVHIFPLGKE